MILRTAAKVFLYSSLIVTVPIFTTLLCMAAFSSLVGLPIWASVWIISFARGETDCPTPIEMVFTVISALFFAFNEIYGFKFLEKIADY